MKSKRMKEPFIYRKDEETAVARAGESKKAEGVMSMKVQSAAAGDWHLATGAGRHGDRS